MTLRSSIMLSLLWTWTTIAFVSCYPLRTNNAYDGSDSEVWERNFEPWLRRNGINRTFVLSEFVGHNRFHPFEQAHLYQGDIKGYAFHTVSDSEGKEHIAINLWPGGVVPYVIRTDNPRPEALLNVTKAMIEFHKRTCIQFKPRTNERSYIKIQLSSSDGCWSYIGRTGRMQEVNLQSPGCTTHATILHELMHAIGFIHEQSRPDRDDYVTIHWDNVDEDNKYNFEKAHDEFFQLNVPYDIQSIMQYDEYSFAKEPGKKTIESKDGRPLGNEVNFADSDVEEINLLYNCNEIIERQERWPTM